MYLVGVPYMGMILNLYMGKGLSEGGHEGRLDQFFCFGIHSCKPLFIFGLQEG